MHGMVFSLGVFVAIVALIFAGYNGVMFWGTTRVNDPAAIAISNMEKEVDGWTPEVALGFFTNEADEGLGTPFPPLWAQIDEMHEAARKRLIGGIVVAGVGLLAAAGALTFGSKRK